MKKILLTVCFACCSIALFGQFNFGIKAGVNISKFSVSSSSGLNYTMAPGFDAGVFARIGLPKDFYLQPEILYSYKTSTTKLTDAATIKDVPDKVKTQMLDVPILVGYKIGSKKVNVRVFLGPRFGFGLSNTFKDFESFGKVLDDKNFDFAGQIGVGVDIFMITLDFLYDYTFTNGYKIEGQSDNPHMNQFKFQVGWKIL